MTICSGALWATAGEESGVGGPPKAAPTGAELQFVYNPEFFTFFGNYWLQSKIYIYTTRKLLIAIEVQKNYFSLWNMLKYMKNYEFFKKDVDK